MLRDYHAVDLPFLTADLPGIGGQLRAADDDFAVDEELPYAASGEGDHVFVRIEKRGLTTPMAVGAIAKALAINERDIGVAGMKDRHAVTKQWISLPPPVSVDQAKALAIDHVAILEAIKHNHKLRTGHVRSNRFRLRVRGATDVDGARAILEKLAQPPGAPNWYGEQRFGRDGDNAARGRELLSGKRGRDRKQDRFLISSLQSELFNAWLVARLRDGLYAQVLTGDVLHKVGGGMFTSEDAAVDSPRLTAGELVVTGPMFGERMRRAVGEAAAREDQILTEAGLSHDSWHAVRQIAEGTRRDASIQVGDPSVERDDDGVVISFALPGGAYATAVMREIMK